MCNAGASNGGRSLSFRYQGNGATPSRVEFLLGVIELLFLSLTVEALQGKMCPLPSGGGRSLEAKISGGTGRPWRIFLVSTKLDTLCYLTVQTASCYVPSL